MMFLDCPAYLDQDGAVRCALPAEVTDRFTVRSTSGPIENVKIRCPSGHWFNGPTELLTPATRQPGRFATSQHQSAEDGTDRFTSAEVEGGLR